MPYINVTTRGRGMRGLGSGKHPTFSFRNTTQGTWYDQQLLNWLPFAYSDTKADSYSLSVMGMGGDSVTFQSAGSPFSGTQKIPGSSFSAGVLTMSGLIPKVPGVQNVSINVNGKGIGSFAYGAYPVGSVELAMASPVQKSDPGEQGLNADSYGLIYYSDSMKRAAFSWTSAQLQQKGITPLLLSMWQQQLSGPVQPVVSVIQPGPPVLPPIQALPPVVMPIDFGPPVVMPIDYPVDLLPVVAPPPVIQPGPPVLPLMPVIQPMPILQSVGPDQPFQISGGAGQAIDLSVPPVYVPDNTGVTLGAPQTVSIPTPASPVLSVGAMTPLSVTPTSTTPDLAIVAPTAAGVVPVSTPATGAVPAAVDPMAFLQQDIGGGFPMWSVLAGALLLLVVLGKR